MCVNFNSASNELTYCEFVSRNCSRSCDRVFFLIFLCLFQFYLLTYNLGDIQFIFSVHIRCCQLPHIPK